jgi:hypothetical protein
VAGNIGRQDAGETAIDLVHALKLSCDELK